KAATVGRATAPVDAATPSRLSDNSSFGRDSQRSAPAPTDATATHIPADDSPPSLAAAEAKLPTNAKSIPADDLSSVAGTQSAPAASGVQFTFGSYLLIAWLLGVLAVSVWLAWETWRALCLRRSVQIVHSAPLEALLGEVRQQLNLRRGAQLGESDAARSPMLVKFRTPCVVFPSGMLGGLSSPSPRPSPIKGEGDFAETYRIEGEGDRTLTPDEIRLVLAHELAHVKRHDLAWNALAAVVHVLLYFHPLVWLASRWSRQEQELACDELVITRLHVAGHDYGQLLLKIVRQLGRGFPTGMAVIGMASSYQTLSRRLTAMKRIRNFSRRQIFLGGLIVSLLGALALVPWRLVAQEAKQPAAGSSQGSGVSDQEKKSTEKGPAGTPPAANSNAPVATKSPAENSSAPAAPGDETTLKKLLIGTWQGGHYYDELILHDDGTFDRFSRYWYYFPRRGRPIQEGAATVAVEPTNDAAYEDRFERGTWKLGQQENTDAQGKTNPVPTLTLDSQIDEHNVPLWRTTTITAPLSSLPPTPRSPRERGRGRGSAERPVYSADLPSGQEVNLDHNVFAIERLDDTLLRLKIVDGRQVMLSFQNDGASLRPENTPTLFFRRENPGSTNPAYAAEIPPEIKQLAQLAGLTPDEAQLLAGMHDNRDSVNIQQQGVDLISRAAAGRAHRIDFAELFNLNPEEAKAFVDLMGMVDDRYATALTLTAGNLSPTETSTMQKLQDFRNQLGDVYISAQQLQSPWRGSAAELNKNRQADARVRNKVVRLVQELNDWLDKSVYNWRAGD
ncbi:MAG TPA: M56 family metallopeptidase, partial [Pirellulales bacterium]|nr:M56 family metallopeptidase [Pirellulales bacterium]